MPSLGVGLFDTEILNQVVRKMAHVFLFAILTILLWRSLPDLNKQILFKLFISLIFLSAFAALDEIHQLYVAGRNGNWIGFSFDLTGVSVGLFFEAVYNKKNMAL